MHVVNKNARIIFDVKICLLFIIHLRSRSLVLNIIQSVYYHSTCCVVVCSCRQASSKDIDHDGEYVFVNTLYLLIGIC